MVTHVLDHSVLLRSLLWLIFSLHCLCCWWCARTCHHLSRKWWVSDLLPQTGQDQGFDTGLSGCVWPGLLHHSPEGSRLSHYWCHLSFGLHFLRLGGWMGLSQSFYQLPTFDLSGNTTLSGSSALELMPLQTVEMAEDHGFLCSMTCGPWFPASNTL
jgi:hypothetical protein